MTANERPVGSPNLNGPRKLTMQIILRLDLMTVSMITHHLTYTADQAGSRNTNGGSDLC